TGTLTASDAADGMSNPNFTVVTDASHGTAVIDAGTGAWTYTPAANFHGADSFTVQVTDDAGNPETQVISITVNPAADLTAVNDGFSTAEDTPLSGSVATNDATTSGGALTFALSTGATHGSLTFNADGSFTYTPEADFHGADSFTYTVTDAASGETATGNVSVTVNEANTAPVTNETDPNSPTDQEPLPEQPNTSGDPNSDSGGVTYDDPFNDEWQPTIDNYQPSDVSGGDDDFSAPIRDPDNDEKETIIYLTDENDKDFFVRRVNDRDNNIFDNNLFKAMASGKIQEIAIGDFHGNNEWETLENSDNEKPKIIWSKENYNKFRNEIDEEFRAKKHSEEIRSRIVTITMATFSAGIVTYLLRTASMIASFISTIPLWRGFDPIIVFSGDRKKLKMQDKTPNADESKLEKLFKGKTE
ncbi:MAG: tandem-95 repeat protein, partial [Deltaproteobacteria bacterium]|nr:tandem-95 repeat protein [Deltaproteobacteria bacterium]